MHSLSEFGANVPAFLAKLWKLVDDPETNELISWSEEGTSFFIRDQAQFSRKLLPMYYKHNNMASFIRQLNMYGFHKIVSADAGSLRLDRDEMEFAHQCFLRGHPYLLEHIKRKVGKSQMLSSKQLEESREVSGGGVVVKPEFMNKMLNEVKHIRGRQDTVETRLTAMKQENEALWRELSLLRQKHMKQQNIVNKLIQFLVTLVQPSQRLSPKRRYPLMINSVAHPNKTNGKVSSHLTVNGNDTLQTFTISLPASQSHVIHSPTGPTIHELDNDGILTETDPELLSDTITLHGPDTELSDIANANIVPEPEVLSPESVVLDALEATVVDPSLLTSVNSGLDPSIVSSTSPNSGMQELTVNVLNADSLSPEMLLAVSPADVNPAIIVPALKTRKGDPNIPTKSATSAPTVSSRINTRSSNGKTTRSVVARKNGNQTIKETNDIPVKVASNSKVANHMKTMHGSGTSPQVMEPLGKELKIIPPRCRKRKGSAGRTSSTDNAACVIPAKQPKSPQQPTSPGKTMDLLTQASLPNPASAASENTNNGPLCGVAASTPSPLVVFPMSESPIPDIYSPGASPCALSPLGSKAPQAAASPLPHATTITDVTNPTVVYPLVEAGAFQEQSSPQPSPRGTQSPFMPDLTLACTSNVGGSSTSSSPALNSSQTFNREELDLHLGTLDNELGQLKDLLHNSGISLDANTLLGLFSTDDPLAYNMPTADTEHQIVYQPKVDPSDSLTTGNELAPYQPDFMDLDELWNENGRSSSPDSPLNLASELNTPVMTPSSPNFLSFTKKRR